MTPEASFIERCSKVHINSDVDNLMNHIHSVMRRNAIGITVCAVTVAICLFATGMMVNRIIDIVKMHLKKTDSTNESLHISENPDDYTYVSTDESKLPPVSERVLISSGMERLRSKYGAYNQAISGYLTQQRRTPDDVLDETVLDATEDNFKYGKGLSGSL